MESSRWWHVAVVGTAVVLSALVVLQQVPTWRLTGVLAVNAVFVLSWFVLGRRRARGGTATTAFVAIVILLAGVGAGFESSMATFQCIAYPLVWTLLPRLRNAVYANIALAAAVGIGTYVGNGATQTALIVAVAIEGLSLVFSLALGLWISSIATRSDERQRLIEQLETTQARLGVLSRDAGAASERERLALEIHDTIAQDLAGLVLTAQRGRRELAGGNAAAAEKQLAILEENARHALAETRALVASGAAVGADGGLATALRRLGERFERETGIAITVTADDVAALDRDAEVVLLRCAQEALANVRKHSAATSATVTLLPKDGGVELIIADDGRGFDAATHSSGFGLDGMRERLAFVNGALDVTTAPGGGATLIARLPGAHEVAS